MRLFRRKNTDADPPDPRTAWPEQHVPEDPAAAAEEFWQSWFDLLPWSTPRSATGAPPGRARALPAGRGAAPAAALLPRTRPARDLRPGRHRPGGPGSCGRSPTPGRPPRRPRTRSGSTTTRCRRCPIRPRSPSTSAITGSRWPTSGWSRRWTRPSVVDVAVHHPSFGRAGPAARASHDVPPARRDSR